ncbi:hypothetical protein WA158_004610 [Blastocystis sp. Blastoise]
MNDKQQKIRDEMLKMISTENDDPLCEMEDMNEDDVINREGQQSKSTIIDQPYFTKEKDTKIVTLKPTTEEEDMDEETYQDIIQKLQSTKKELKPKKAPKYGEIITPELTPELKNDLKIMTMRGFIDPKSFFKGEKRLKKLPKKFEMGTVIAGRMDNKTERMTKKERKSTILQELMSDTQVQERAHKVATQNANKPGKKVFHKKGKKFSKKH